MIARTSCSITRNGYSSIMIPLFPFFHPSPFCDLLYKVYVDGQTLTTTLSLCLRRQRLSGL